MATDFEPLSGLYKHVYAKNVNKLIPDTAPFQKIFGLNSGTTQLGRDFLMPVEVTRTSGHTATVQTSGVDLNDAVSQTVEEAKVTSARIVQPALLSYPEIQAALTAAKKGGEKAFVNATSYKMERLRKDAAYLQELQYRWGTGTAANDAAGALDNLGEVDSTASVSSGIYDITLTAASWCAAIWMGKEGTGIDVRVVTTGAQLLAAGFILSQVDPDTYTLRLTGDDTALGNIAQGDHLHFMGTQSSDYENQMVGASQILTNTGTLFDISAAEYSLWKSYQMPAINGPLTAGHVTQATRRAADLGFRGEMVVLAGPESWGNVANDMAALVDQPGGVQDTYGIGCAHIKVKSEVGVTTVVSDPYMKRGYAMLLPKQSVMRVGNSEGTFDPSGRGFKIQDHPSKDCAIVRYYSDQAIMCKTPAFATLISGIIPS